MSSPSKPEIDQLVDNCHPNLPFSPIRRRARLQTAIREWRSSSSIGSRGLFPCHNILRQRCRGRSRRRRVRNWSRKVRELVRSWWGWWSKYVCYSSGDDGIDLPSCVLRGRRTIFKMERLNNCVGCLVPLLASD